MKTFQSLFLSTLIANTAAHPAFAREQPHEHHDVVGIGVLLRADPEAGYPRIMQIMPGSPAAENGRLAPGDWILAVADGDGPFIFLEHKPLQEVVALIRGRTGSEVTLKVRLGRRQARAGDEIVLSLTRAPIPLLPTDHVGEPVIIWEDPPRIIGPLRLDESHFDHLFPPPPDKVGVVQPDYQAWSHVAIGMTEDEVIDLLGEPRYRIDSPEIPFEELKRAIGDIAAEVVGGPLPAGATLFYGWLSFDAPPARWRQTFEITLSENKVTFVRDPFVGELSKDGSPTMPQLLVPSPGQVLDHYPRFLDLRWVPSSGRYPMEYIIQLETEVVGRWRREEFQSDIPYQFTVFSGKNQGRWRVKARNALGESDWSEYRHFEFTR